MTSEGESISCPHCGWRWAVQELGDRTYCPACWRTWPDRTERTGTGTEREA